MKGKLPERTAALYFGSLADSDFEEKLAQTYPGARFILLTDETVAGHWAEFMVTRFEILHRAEIIELPAGEESKNLAICQSVWEALSEYEVGRSDVIINLGGGMITDLGGFVASTFKRGVPFINLPTSLLAQVDAAVGGKTGVDLGPLKNQVGLFAEPDFVFLDTGFLQTLPTAQLLSGFAEMLKHALIADEKHWHQLSGVNPTDLSEIAPHIPHSVSIKKSIVERDYHETGLRKILNFGHTIGHALEGYQLSLGKPILHGYAVGLGMIAEAYLSWQHQLLSQTEFEAIRSTCWQHFGNSLQEKPDPEALLKLMQNDKKNTGNQIRFSLLQGIGRCVFDQQVETTLIRNSLYYLSSE